MKTFSFRPKIKKAPIKKRDESIPIKTTYDSDIGIYIISCDFIQKVYVGQSKNIPIRMRQHKYALKNNKYSRGSNSAFQADFNKHGISSFKFTQICNCEEHELYYWETYYCKEYIQKGYTLYNHFANTEITGLVCPLPIRELSITKYRNLYPLS